MRIERINEFGTPRDRTVTRKRLSPWAEQAKAHWKEHRPRMYAELEKAGTLDEAAERAAKQTKEEYVDAIYNGMSPDGAWEAVRENHLFLPTEEDVPLLGENPKGYDTF
jgi:hypothetical protein